MGMTLYEILSLAAAIGLIVVVLVAINTPPTATGARTWQFPALLCAIFAAGSFYAVAQEGPFGFIPIHMNSAWGVQVFVDLLIAAGTAFILLIPRLRAAGMRPLPWFVLVAATGSIGLTAMLARCLYREGRANAA